MFKTLLELPALESVVAQPEPAPVVDLDALWLELAESALETQDAFHTLQAEARTCADLAALYETIAEQGVTRSVLSLINRDGALSQAIPALPALEALGEDLTGEAAEAACEGVLTAFKGMLKRWKAAAAEAARKERLDSEIRNRSVSGLHSQLDMIKRSVEGKTWNAAQANAHHMALRSASTQLKCLELVDEVHAFAEKALRLTIPSTREQFESWRHHYLEAFRATIVKTGFVDPHRPGEVRVPTTHSITAHMAGYGAEQFHALLGRVEAHISSYTTRQHQFQTEWEHYFHQADQMITHASVVLEDQHGNQTTLHTGAAQVMVAAADHTLAMLRHAEQQAYRVGIVDSYRALRALTMVFHGEHATAETAHKEDGADHKTDETQKPAA